MKQNVSGTDFPHASNCENTKPTHFLSLITRSSEEKKDVFNQRLGNFILQVLSVKFFQERAHNVLSYIVLLQRRFCNDLKRSSCHINKVSVL